MKRSSLGLAACLVLTCARPGQPELAHAEPGKSQPPPALASASVPAAPPPSALPRIEEVPGRVAARGALSTFFDRLRELAAGTRSEHVRLLWLGDSHTAADFLSGSVRAGLQARFGDAGPGFVRVGTRSYRHDGLKIVRDGNWNVDPDPPARRALQDDGVFGFAGTRAVPAPGASFSVEISPRPSRPDEAASFEFSYTLPAGSSFDVELGDKRSRVTAQSSSDVAASGISHLTLTAPLRSHLLLAPRSGTPRLFGLVIERTAQVGVVLDTAGIDGARLETPLSWNETAFAAEVARRSPQLFVIAYGTNEAFDGLKVDRYAGHLEKLVQRLRAGAAQASCLVLGPTDAPLGEGSVPRVAEVSQVLERASASLGCGYLSLQRLMGGEGSFAKGMRAPAKERLAQPDKLHLTPKGYQELGRTLGKLLLDAYSAGRVDLP